MRWKRRACSIAANAISAVSGFSSHCEGRGVGKGESAVRMTRVLSGCQFGVVVPFLLIAEA